MHSNILFSRIALLCSGLAVFLGTIGLLCGGNTIACIAVITADGLIAAGWIAGAIALGAVLLRRFGLETNRALFIATAGGLGLGIFSLLGLGLGLLGWLNRPIAIVFPAVSMLLFLIDLLRSNSFKKQIDRSAIEAWLRAPAGVSWLWLVPIVALAIAAASASMMPGILWGQSDPAPYDVTGYHLLVPREWYEGGRIVPLEHNVYSFFEFNVEMQFLLLMHASGGPWAGMYACQFLCVGYAVLMVAAVYGSGVEGKRSTFNVQRSTFKEEQKDDRPRGRVLDYSSVESWKLNVERWTFASGGPLVAGAIASTVPWAIMLAGVAYVESALMLYTALSIAWALHAIANQKHFVRSAILSGLMAGFACGVKITAVPMLLLAVPVGLFVVLTIRKQSELTVKRLMIGCAALVLVGSITVSPWLIRNYVWAHNPLFPVGMKILGRDHFDDVQVRRFHDAHSPPPRLEPFTAKLAVSWRDVLAHWQFGYLILPAGLLACFARFRDRQTWLILICGLFVVVVWFGFTHLIPRFLVMLIPIAALAIGRVHWGRAWPGALALLLIAAWLGWSGVMHEFLGRPQVFGLEDMTAFIDDSPELVAARNQGMQIGMVGDAEAFLYPIPLNRLHYRAVFNLHTGTDDPVMAWIGPAPIGNPNWLLVIHPTEITRLHATYYGVPDLPADWADRGNKVFFLRGDQLRRK